MISRDNPLDPIWNTYLTTRDCLKITDRARQRNDISLLRRTQFVGMEEDEALAMMRSCYDKLNDFVIIALWAVFERFIIDYIQKKGECLSSVQPAFLAEPLVEKFEFSVERLWLADILDWLKDHVCDGNLVGDAKKIKKFRDYIAHENPKKKPEDRVGPETVYNKLSVIIKKIQQETKTP